MKKVISFLGIVLLSSCLLNAQALVDNRGYACGKNAPPVLVEGLTVTVYQTASAENLLTLDTASGEVWHVRLADNQTDTYKTILSPAILTQERAKEPGRFVLTNAGLKNVNSYILFDTVTGSIKLITWNPDPAQDTVYKVDESPFLSNRRRVGTL